MPLTGLDIAWARPTDSDILGTGARFVARYLSPDASKNITAAEVQGYPHDGISVVVVWESTAQRMLDGHAAGVADAQAAEAERKAVGLPDDQAIYFACDFDVQGGQFSTINDYMRGVNSVIGLNRSGFYGGYYAVENVAAAPTTATYFWQADAWSNGRWSAHANIRQDGGTAIGGSADIDHAMTDDYGQYPRPQAAAPQEDDLLTQAMIDLWNGMFWGFKNQLDKLTPQIADIQAKVDALPAMQTAIIQAIGDSKLTAADIQAALANGTLKVQVSVQAA
jgi:hypothetical protein